MGYLYMSLSATLAYKHVNGSSRILGWGLPHGTAAVY